METKPCLESTCQDLHLGMFKLDIYIYINSGVFADCCCAKDRLHIAVVFRAVAYLRCVSY